jgi:hypothetical protein
MLIIGCDFHTRYQQIAMLDTENGELVERRLEHANGEARALRGPHTPTHAVSGACGKRALTDSA